MSVNQEKTKISPVLFMTVDGEPMAFFLRPGPVKRKLQPLITAGGGTLCNTQQPGSILLIDPGESGSVTESTAHWFVSTQYIYDCVEKDEQLNLEDYKFKPDVVQRQSARLNSAKESSNGRLAGRVAYTTEDDAAILKYVSKHMSDIGGNRLWQSMAKKRVTSHSWQSMKYRYKVQLAKKQSTVEEVVTTEEDKGENKMEEDQETVDETPPSAGPSPEDDRTQGLTRTENTTAKIDTQSIPAEAIQPELAEAHTSISPQEEERVNPQTVKEPAERTEKTVEAETFNSPQPKGPCLDPLADPYPIPAESSELKTDEPQTSSFVSPQKESVPEDTPPPQPKSLPSPASQKKPEEKEKTSPVAEQPHRRSARRQLQLQDSSSPEPCSKTLRSSPNSAKQLTQSPKPQSKTKSAVRLAAREKDRSDDEPPSKKAREESGAAAAAEGEQEERGPSPVPETQAESVSVPPKGEKKKQKRKLGILEMATREFEDESEPEEDRTPDLQNSPEAAAVEPTETEPRPPSADGAAPTESSPEHEPAVLQSTRVSRLSSSKGLPAAGGQEPAAPETVDAASRPHLFIFESETQEEESQSIFAPAGLQPTANKDSAFSLTQVQLEDDKQRIRELMKETNKDLVTVTKALLKTSGDFSDALDLLLNPLSNSRTFWECCDDDLLLTGDPGVRQRLQKKYSEELVAKRIVFLELEGRQCGE